MTVTEERETTKMIPMRIRMETVTVMEDLQEWQGIQFELRVVQSIVSIKVLCRI